MNSAIAMAKAMAMATAKDNSCCCSCCPLAQYTVCACAYAILIKRRKATATEPGHWTLDIGQGTRDIEYWATLDGIDLLSRCIGDQRPRMNRAR